MKGVHRDCFQWLEFDEAFQSRDYCVSLRRIGRCSPVPMRESFGNAPKHGTPNGIDLRSTRPRQVPSDRGFRSLARAGEQLELGVI